MAYVSETVSARLSLIVSIEFFSLWAFSTRPWASAEEIYAGLAKMPDKNSGKKQSSRGAKKKARLWFTVPQMKL